MQNYTLGASVGTKAEFTPDHIPQRCPVRWKPSPPHDKTCHLSTAPAGKVMRSVVSVSTLAVEPTDLYRGIFCTCTTARQGFTVKVIGQGQKLARITKDNNEVGLTIDRECDFYKL